MKSLIFSVPLLLLGLFGCDKQTRFERRTPNETGVDFVNKLTLTDSFNILEFDYIYNGGGVAVGDFNNDDLPDLFFTGNQVSCELYLNKGNLKFEKVTSLAGVTTTQWTEGVTVVDINNDRLLDIYISTSSGGQNLSNQNLLFINEGISQDGVPTFSEQASAYGIADTGYNTQAAFFDYDLDGDLDLYILSNALENFNRNTTRQKKLDGSGNSTDKLYRNNGDGTFSNVSEEAGILVEGYGLGIAVTDINKDGWPDVYLANDFVTNDILYINNQDGTFTNQIQKQMKHQSHNGMGADAADYNNDGYTDILVLDMMPEDNLRQKAMMFPFASYDRFMLNLSMDYEPQYVRNTLQLNNGDGTFSEIGQLADIYQTDWSWAPLFADLNNDGLKDLFITNGYGKDITDMDYVAYSQSLRSFGTPESKRKALLEEIKNLVEIRLPNYAYQNQGNLIFEDKSEEWGLADASLSNGAAFSDLDNDGDLDLVVNNVNDPAFVYENTSTSKNDSTSNHLKISLKGQEKNLKGIGAKIYLSYLKNDQNHKQYYEHFPTRGYKSTVDHTIHFGLGSVTNVDKLKVIWPDGNQEIINDVKANQMLTLDYKNAATPNNPDINVELPKEEHNLFETPVSKTGLNYTHTATDFADFKIQPLLPHKHSENGPGIAVGDINQDGLDDFYIGGSPGNPGKLFVQNEDGSFTNRTIVDNQVSDDMGALFFDSDNDGDLDLYIVSGGSRFPAKSPQYRDRFYRNDGHGNFTQDTTAIPQFYTSGSVVTASDFDADGDLDLFVGGRITPHEYPLPASSYLLENNGGQFRDVTQEILPQLSDLGMVTTALWTDVNDDKKIDLMVAGEWMPISIFKQESDGTFTDITGQSGLASASGWWNSLQSGDFDQDGDIDYIGGNLGLNSRYKASIKEPLSLYTRDFDNNGEIDPLMFYYNEGENYPVHTRNKLISQIAGMKGRFPKYESLGKTTFEDFFREGELDGAYVLKSFEMRTSLIENLGDGTFKVTGLPIQAQFSPVCGSITDDVNEDGNLDVVMIGNSYGTELYTGRYDAGYGTVLLGDGTGNFQTLPAKETGFQVAGNARALARLTTGKKDIFLASQNRDNLIPYEVESNRQVIELEPMDQSALIEYKDGRKIKYEFYYGASYLSQSSRILALTNPSEIKALTIVTYQGKTREINLPGSKVTMR